MITNDMIIQAKEHLHDLTYTQWVTEQFLSPTWLGTVAFILFSYAVFFYLSDKKRITEILLYGSLVAVSYTVYDTFGAQFVYWTYLKRIFPLTPSIFADALTIAPLYSMLVYQYSPSWRSFMLWNAVWAGLIAFGLQSLFISLNAFAYHITGGPLYHFAFLLTAGLIARGIMVALLGMEAKAGNMASEHSLSSLIAQPATKPVDKQPGSEDQ